MPLTRSNIPVPVLLKRFAWIYLPIILILSLVVLVNVRLEEKNWVKGVVAEENSRIEIAKSHVAQDFAGVDSDLRVIANLPLLRRYLDTGSPVDRDELANFFLVLSKEKHYYDKVRYLDASGREVIRINYNEGKPAIVPHQQLQDKSKRYFFNDVFRLKQGEIYVSPLDLNVEANRLEIPYKPTIRIGTPVFDRAGHKKGILLFNYFGNDLLLDFNKVMQAGDHNGMLLNSKGYWLASANHADEWGFMLGKAERTFGHEFAEEWRTIFSSERGTLLTTNGLFIYGTVHPLLLGEHSSSGSDSVQGVSEQVMTSQDYYWKIVSYVPPGVLSGAAFYNQTGNVILIVLVYLLLAMAAYFIARTSLIRRQAEQALLSSAQKHQLLFESSRDALMILAPPSWKFIGANQATLKLFGASSEAEFTTLGPWDVSPLQQPDGRPSSEKAQHAIAIAMREGSHFFEWEHQRLDGKAFASDVLLTRMGEGGALFLQATVRDISERKHTEEALHREKDEQKILIAKLEEAQNHLIQSEKMASIGQLAAGVAHEINNPIGYVYSNLGTLEKYVQDTFGMIDLYEQAESSITDADVHAKLKAAKVKLDIIFLREDLRALMNESKDGITRVKQIVQNLKDFSHVDTGDEWCFSDLHKGLDSTLNIVNNEIKYKADLIKEYGEIPEVECLISQINQVLMNLLVNAAHAIEERGTITIRTGRLNDEVWVEVADTGKGIAPEHIKKIFEPFFTTKPVGKGTGLGLSLSYSIIRKHHGRIEVQSEVGKGTTFRVILPITQPPEDQA
jgi:PAS domain S-box-containing protein